MSGKAPLSGTAEMLDKTSFYEAFSRSKIFQKNPQRPNEAGFSLETLQDEIGNQRIYTRELLIALQKISHTVDGKSFWRDASEKESDFEVLNSFGKKGYIWKPITPVGHLYQEKSFARGGILRWLRYFDLAGFKKKDGLLRLLKELNKIDGDDTILGVRSLPPVIVSPKDPYGSKEEYVLRNKDARKCYRSIHELKEVWNVMEYCQELTMHIRKYAERMP